MSRKQKKATLESEEVRADTRSMESAERALQAARPYHMRFRTDAIMDERQCSGCKHLYGYAPYRPERGSERVRPRLRHGEIKWCPTCEEPRVVLLRPMLWRGVPIAPYRYQNMVEALELADRLGIGLLVKEEPDTRSVGERLRTLGMEGAH